jgi:cell division protease FtsH
LNSTIRSLAFWLFAAVVAVAVWNFSTQYQTNAKPLSFSEFMASVDAGQVEKVTITGFDITGTSKNNESFRTYAPPQYEGLANKLIERNVVVTAREPAASPWAAILYTWAPILLMIGFWLFFMRQMQSGGNKALSFGKSKAKLSSSAQKKVTFKDVAGVDEAKDELQEIIEFLREPQKFQKLGGRIPKGVLLMGPPGTGKTLMARAVAGEANVPFFSISGSDFVEMFVGVGASRVRDLFEQGKKNAPCIVFIDEIDAVGRHRGAGLGGGHDEREQTLNQLLVEMDGFESNEGVILVAATNRPDVLDPALLRPGRFDRQVTVGNPDLRGREAILGVHSRKIAVAEDVNLRSIARGTPGFSGADLANLVNEAALAAGREGRDRVTAKDMESARDKVLMGVERRSVALSEMDRVNCAYHEAGHAVIAALLPMADPLHKVTIIPRGRAMGVTMQLPEADRHTYTKGYLETQIAVLMGGRAAEELFMNHMTSGASNDIERATDIAQHMVCEWGMSALGMRAFRKAGNSFEGDTNHAISEALARRVDEEIEKILNGGYDRALDLLNRNREAVKAIAEALLEVEALDAGELKELLARAGAHA